MGESQSDWEPWFVDQKDVYVQILDALADMVLVKGADSRIAWANKAFRDYYGMTNAQLRDIIDAPFNGVDNTAQYVRDDLHVFTTGQTLDIPEEPVTRFDGLEQLFHTVKSPIRDGNGRVRMTVGVSRNITEQRRTQQDLARYREHLERLVGERTAELQNLSERLQIILASLVEGIVALDADGRVQLINPAARTLTGLSAEAAQGQRFTELIHFDAEEATHTPDGDLLNELLRAHQPAVGHLRARDGSDHLVAITSAPLTSADSKPLGWVLVLRDVALEREVEAQRLRQQKLETVGLLAGGIAHDFNNILTGILGSIAVARLHLKSGKDPGDLLEDAERACMSAQRLTTQLLTFAKGGKPVKRVLNIESPVRRAAELGLRGSAIRLAFTCSAGTWPVEADEGQLEQAINNIVINAKQAMSGSGQIEITLANQIIAESDSVPLPAGRYVSIAIRDQGVGIPAGHLPRIFDPYFTTKDRGTGLGLASVHSIIRQHGGHVAVTSTLHVGSCFTIHLPAAAQPNPIRRLTPVQPVENRARKILILDDDARVRSALRAMLEALAQRPYVTAFSAEAFAAFEAAQRQGEPFDVSFVDLTMPGDLSGAAVVTRLREMDPDAKVVVMSGYSVDPVLAAPGQLRLKGTLRKPFTMEDLSEVLRRC